MKIYLDTTNYSYNLIIEAENVKIIEDIQERIYPKKEDGSSDLSKSPKIDIEDDAMKEISALLEEMAYFRKSEFDSQNLVKKLMDKMPEKMALELIKRLAEDYDVEI